MAPPPGRPRFPRGRPLPPGPPDQGPSTTALDRSLGAAVRALGSSRGGEVKEIRYQGREAWALETEPSVPDYAEDYEFRPNHLEVVVDKETGFPVRALASRDGKMIYEARTEDLEVDGNVLPDAFTLEFPPGVEVSRSDAASPGSRSTRSPRSSATTRSSLASSPRATSSPR